MKYEVRLVRLHTSYPAYKDGTDRVFRNVGIQQSDAAEIPKRIHTRICVLEGPEDDSIRFETCCANTIINIIKFSCV